MRLCFFPHVMNPEAGSWLNLTCLCADSVKKRSGEGLEVVRAELEEREKVREELHGIQLWLEAAEVLLNEMEQGRSTQELQVRQSSTKSLPV